MSLAQSLLPEFDAEMSKSREALTRVPMERGDWKPHPKSASLVWLVKHMTCIPLWGKMVMTSESFDIGGTHQQPSNPGSNQELVATFDANLPAFREALASATDEQMMQPWSLKNGEQVVFTMPRVTVLRDMIFNHLIHHRGQLTVYLRLNDIPVPALYGPSADG